MSLLRYSFVWVCLCLLFSATHLQAQTTATITGIVSDSVGRPIENASVTWIGGTERVFSNAQGRYTIQIPAGKDITLVYQFVDCREQQRTINLPAGATQSINVSLRSKNSTTKATEIYGDRKGEFGTTLPPLRFQNLPAPSQDISAYLRFVGATSNNELSSQYSVRGGNFDENLVYVNDIEVYRPFLTRAGQQEGLSFTNVDMVESIFFSAGGFEAKYGDKLSSVLDIRYRRPRHFAGVFSASLLGGSVEVEGLSKDMRFSWMLGIRQKSNRYLLKSLDTEGDYTASFTDIQTLLTYDLTENWQLNYLGNYAVNKYRLVPQTRETEFGTLNNALRFTVFFDGQEINSFQTAFNALSLDYSNNRDTRWKFSVSSFYTSETETFDVQGQYYIDQLEADFGKPTFGQVAFNRGVGTFINHARNYLDAYVTNVEIKGWKIDSLNNWTWGMRGQNERIYDQLSEWNFVDSSGYSIPYYPLTSLDLQDVVKTKANLFSYRAMAYIQYKREFMLADSSVLGLTVGVRGNWWSFTNQTLISPRAQLYWKPRWDSRLTLKAAGGVYSQPAFYRELRGFDGKINDQIKAQNSYHILVGSDLDFKAWDRPFRFIAEAYYKALTNIIPYEVNDVRIRYFGQNLANGYAYGLDLRMNGEFVKGTESWVNLSLLRTREDLTNDDYFLYLNSDGDTIVPGYTLNNTPTDSILQSPGFIPRPTDQLLTFALFFQDYLPKFPKFKMNLGLILGTGLPFGPPTRERYKAVFRMPPYRRVDIGFSYQIIDPEKPLDSSKTFRFLKSLWIGAEVYNLLQVNNTISYYWVKDVTGRQYGVPNYLTNRQLSVRLIARF